jgi:hypothetical protein
MNILIIRAFVRIRQYLATHKDLAAKIEKVESTQRDHTALLQIVVKDIENIEQKVVKELKRPSEPRRRRPRIGFKVE